MNEIDSATTLPDGTAVITTAHLVIVAVLIVAAILVIWWGSRRRARERAERDARGVEPVVRAAPTPAPMAPPVTSSPSPLIDEPPIVVPAAAPVETPTPEPVASTPEATKPVPGETPAEGDADQPVTLLKGLGPKVAARLGELGIATIGQLAVLSPAEAEALDAALGAFRGRMARDRWIEQAKLLAAGDRATYEATFGKLG